MYSKACCEGISALSDAALRRHWATKEGRTFCVYHCARCHDPGLSDWDVTNVTDVTDVPQHPAGLHVCKAKAVLNPRLIRLQYDQPP